MIHQIHAHRLLCKCEGHQTNQLQVPDGPTKCPLIMRAWLNKWAPYIVVVCIALDQDGPKQNSLTQLLWPQVLTKVQILYLEGPAQH